MIVMKFGGTSLGNASRIRRVSKIIESRLEQRPVVVVSAVSGVTSALIELSEKALSRKKAGVKPIKKIHQEIIKKLGLRRDLLDGELGELENSLKSVGKFLDNPLKFKDLILSYGERMSSKILVAYLLKNGIDAEQHNAFNIGMITDDNFGNAEPLEGSYRLIKTFLEEFGNGVPVITGFIGKNKKGEITTLGRGGSDYTASIIGNAINAEEIEIWTDVPGVMTADPRIVKNARTIETLSFQEASEISTFGAKVVHPKTIQPALAKGIPVKILNTFDPSNHGTTIRKEFVRKRPMAAISFKRNVDLVKVKSTKMFHAPGFLYRLFKIFDEEKISIDVIATSEVSVSFSLDSSLTAVQRKEIINRIREFGNIEFISGEAVLSVIGGRLKEERGIISRITSVLAKNGININLISYGASEININFILAQEDIEKAVRVLHREFFE